MRRSSLIVVILICVLFIFTGCVTTEKSESGTIAVSATSVISVSPDTASFSITAEAISLTTEEARNETAKMIQDALLILKDEFGITDDEITTDYMNISPYYEWIDSKRTLTGQRATQSLTITLRASLDKAGRVYDRLAILDGISISSITYSKSEREEDESRARSIASSLALKKAQDYASGVNLTVGKVLSLTEGSVSQSSFGYANSKLLVADSLEGSVPTTYYATDLTISSTVTVIFELND